MSLSSRDQPSRARPQAMLLKADALFDLGEYEHALIYYQRGRCHRPTINNFRRGIRKSEEAIINSDGGEAVSNINHFGAVSDSLGQLAAASECMASFTNLNTIIFVLEHNNFSLFFHLMKFRSLDT